MFVVAVGSGPAAIAGLDPIDSSHGRLNSACDDGRAWTSDHLRNGECHYVNRCSLSDVDLAIDDRLRWSWEFDDACPMSAIDAVGALLTRAVPAQPAENDADTASDPIADGPTGSASRYVNRVGEFGQPDPPRAGGGSAPATCGRSELLLTFIAGSEVVATARGSAISPPCDEDGDAASAPVPLLGAWDGTSGEVASVARLYWAVFGRRPDTEGFAYWMARLHAGLDFTGMASTWTSLPEWRDAYDGTDDEAFLTAVYGNVLGRTADAGGFSYWLGRLGGGLERSELVLLVSDSPEFRARTNTG